MSIQMRWDVPGLPTKRWVGAGKPSQAAPEQGKELDTEEELRTKRQQLQNELLLLRATGTDSGGVSEEQQRMLEEAMERVTAQLRTAQAKSPPGWRDSRPSDEGPRVDTYEPRAEKPLHPGLYELKRDEGQGYRVLFLPYEQGEEPED